MVQAQRLHQFLALIILVEKIALVTPVALLQIPIPDIAIGIFGFNTKGIIESLLQGILGQKSLLTLAAIIKPG